MRLGELIANELREAMTTDTRDPLQAKGHRDDCELDALLRKAGAR